MRKRNLTPGNELLSFRTIITLKSAPGCLSNSDMTLGLTVTNLISGKVGNQEQVVYNDIKKTPVRVWLHIRRAYSMIVHADVQVRKAREHHIDTCSVKLILNHDEDIHMPDYYSSRRHWGYTVMPDRDVMHIIGSHDTPSTWEETAHKCDAYQNKSFITRPVIPFVYRTLRDVLVVRDYLMVKGRIRRAYPFIIFTGFRLTSKVSYMY